MGNKLSISDEEIEELVLKAAQAKEDCSITRLVKEANKHNALEIYERIHDSVTRKILELGLDINIRADKGFTPLIAAATFGNHSLIKILLAKGADMNLQDYYFGNTALIAAAVKNFPDIVSELLMAGADETIVNKVGEMTAIQAAEDKNNKDVVKMFALCHKPENLDHEMMTAARAGNARLMSGLITAGADIETRDEASDSALHIAARKGLDGVVLALLDQGINADLRGGSQRTALIIAATFGHLTIVRTLMDAGADASLKDEDEKSALEEAVENNHLRIVIELLDRGVVKDPDDSFDMESPLNVELQGFREAALMGMILDQNKIETNNVIGAESLRVATENGSVNVVKNLLDRGACLDHRPEVGETPFQVAVRLPQIEKDEYAKYMQKLAEVNMKPKSTVEKIMKKANNKSNEIAKMFLLRPMVNCDTASVSQRLSDIFNWTQKGHFDETILGAEKKVFVKYYSKDKETLMKSLVGQGSFDKKEELLTVLGMKIHFQSI